MYNRKKGPALFEAWLNDVCSILRKLTINRMFSFTNIASNISFPFSVAFPVVYTILSLFF